MHVCGSYHVALHVGWARLEVEATAVEHDAFANEAEWRADWMRWGVLQHYHTRGIDTGAPDSVCDQRSRMSIRCAPTDC